MSFRFKINSYVNRKTKKKDQSVKVQHGVEKNRVLLTATYKTVAQKCKATALAFLYFCCNERIIVEIVIFLRKCKEKNKKT